MNFKFKSLVAAVALSAVAMSAQAEIDSGSQTNSEIFFSAWNDNVSYTFDLDSALTLNSLVGNDGTVAGNFVSNLPTFAPGTVVYDGALTGFSSTFSSLDGLQWNLAAFDNNGLKRFVSTQDVSVVGSVAVSNLKVNDAASGMSSFTGAINANMIDAPATGTDVYGTALSSEGSAYAGTRGATWGNNLLDTTNVMGATSALGFYARTSLSSGQGNAAPIYANLGLTARTYQDGQGAWRLELAALPAVTAVPEPESYAMMLAGLALLGGVARRRNNKA